MIEPSVTFYPLDLSGTLASNRVLNEKHILVQIPNRPTRVFATKFGAHYTKDLVVRDADGKKLTPGTDYVSTYHYDLLSDMTGLEAMALVVIKRAAIKQPVYCDYNAVGGFFSPNAEELKAALDKLALDELHFAWEDIVGKPEAYPPAEHQDEYWQLYGLDPTVVELYRIAAGIPLGMDSVVAASTEYYQQYLVEAQALLDKYRTDLNVHLADKANPHQTDKVKIGLPNMNNWSVSTDAQIMDKNNANTYMPIGGVYKQLQVSLQNLNTHVTNFNNPHISTAAMVTPPISTKATVNSQLATRLRWTGTAADTTLYGGLTATEVTRQIRENIPASAVTTGRFPMTQLTTGGGVGSTAWVLVGNQQCRDIVNDLYPKMFKQASKVIYFGYTSLTNPLTVLAAYANRTYYPVGTIAVGVVQMDTNDHRYIYDLRAYICTGPAANAWSLY